MVLAAGRGRRLAPMGWDKPKCLLEFGGQTLLERILICLGEHEIDRFVVVVGYRRRLVEEALRECPTGCDVVVNEDFASTNTIHSLWLARDVLDDDFLYFNADVLFDRRIIRLLLDREHSALAVEAKSCGLEEVKVVADSDGRILRIGKDLPPQQCSGEFIGVGRFTKSCCPALLASLRRYNDGLGLKDLFFESAVDSILSEHIVQAIPIQNLRAVEIDTPEDYTRAQDLWSSQVIK